MTNVQTMLNTYPKDLGDIDREKLVQCIEACFECARVCTACADACLAEEMMPVLAKCIRTDLDCAEICTVTGNVLTRRTGYDANVARALLEACRLACHACADECARHATMHEHCRVCADACRNCEQACAALVSA